MAGFAVKTAGIMILLWLAAFFGYGDFILKDSIVPVEGMEVEEWIDSYRITGGISGIVGFILSAIWFNIGDNYAGESGINVKYYALFVLSIVIGAALAIFKMPPSIEGSGLAFVMVTGISFLTYYLSSLFAYAEPVKYIPPLGEVLH